MQKTILRSWNFGKNMEAPEYIPVSHIHAREPKIGCIEHGKRVVDLPWARKGPCFSLYSEALIQRLAGRCLHRKLQGSVDSKGCGSVIIRWGKWPRRWIKNCLLHHTIGQRLSPLWKKRNSTKRWNSSPRLVQKCMHKRFSQGRNCWRLRLNPTSLRVYPFKSMTNQVDWLRKIAQASLSSCNFERISVPCSFGETFS